MDRMKEFEELNLVLENTPAELEYTVNRAKARAKRRKSHRWGLPLGSLAGVCAAFILLVNTIPTFALACAGIPLLGDLAAAVDWSGSMRRALENDYVQVIGQSQTKNGITMTAEYVIVDQQQVNLFVSVKNADESRPYTTLNYDIDAGGRAFAVVTSGQQDKNGELRCYTIDFNDKNQVPDHMTITFWAYPFESLTALAEAGRPADSDPVGTEFTFDISFDPAYTASGAECVVESLVELDGQSIYVETLEIYPTHARLKLRDGADNKLCLVDLDFYLEDEDGNRYDSEGGLGGYNDPETSFAFDRRVESPWFAKSEHLTMFITGVSWLDPDARDVTVDLRSKRAAGLPEGVELLDVSRMETGTALYFQAPMRGLGSCDLFGWSYFDPTGTEYRCTHSSVSTRNDLDVMQPVFYLEEDYAEDIVILRLNRTQWHSFETPVEVVIR